MGRGRWGEWGVGRGRGRGSGEGEVGGREWGGGEVGGVGRYREGCTPTHCCCET